MEFWLTSGRYYQLNLVSGDPRLQAFLQAWRQMFPGTVEVDIFREVEE